MNNDFFISYCKTEKNIAHYLCSQLTALGFTVWIDDREIRLGQSIEAIIDFALQDSKRVIALISKDYLLSEWPLREIRRVLLIEPAIKQEILLPFLYKVDMAEVISVIPELAGKAVHMVENTIEENRNLWLAKVMISCFSESCLNISSYKNLCVQTVDTEIIKTLCVNYKNSRNVMPVSIVNLYNLGAFSLYLCKKYHISICRNALIAYCYLEKQLQDIYEPTKIITLHHQKASELSVALIVDQLRICSDN
jgi:hypothetical protein